MGQKLSGFTLTMEEEDLRREEEGEKTEANGNSGEADHIFEVIYSSRNEPGTSSPDVLNGNVYHDEQCSSREPSCACALKPKAKTGAIARKRPDEIAKRSTLRTITFPSGKKSRGKRTKESGSGCVSVKKRAHWGIRLNCAGLKQDADIPEGAATRESGCVCTGYRRTTEPSPPVIDLSRFNPHDFPIEDCDERARLERAREMAEGVEPPPGFGGSEINLDSLAMFFQTRLGLHAGVALSALSQIDVSLPTYFPRMHSQADFIHCLVPDLLQITSCSFYWGKMDRYEAERLLEGRPEGTFLLRDSAQEEFLFSVSFRKYGRSLHARIEQWNHRFSFDSHDPGVFASPTVCGLIEHYKDSSFCMFFEPMLTIPLHRNYPFPLQHLCRATVCSRTDYDSISRLHLPKALKSYLREYHYKQRVRIRNLDTDL